jgi:hypothetical protein
LRIIPLIDEEIGEDLTWMHDNASPHRSPESLREQKKRDVPPIVWPACSSDLNPIETIWFIIKQRIKAYENPPTRIQELRDALAAEWAKSTHEEILAVMNTMPKQCAAVKAANGGSTKF